MAEADERRLLDTIHALYAAAQEPAAWPGALERAADLLGATAAALVTVAAAGDRLLFSAGHNLDRQVFDDYQQHIIRIDPRLHYCRTHPERELFFDRLHHSERAMDRDPYYAWLRGLGGLRYYAAIRTTPRMGSSVYFSVQRTRGEAHVGEADLGTLRLLRPHVQRCTELAVLLGERGVRAESAEEALHRLRAAVVILDGGGRVVFANAEAERLLAAGEILRKSREQKLEATRSAADRALQTSIARALQELAAPLAASPSRPAIDLTGRWGVTADVQPLFAGEPSILGSHGAVAVYVRDPAAASRHIVLRLRERYGLTPAEIELCRALLAGESLRRYAVRADLAIETVRSHMKRVLAKTGADRQASLVAMLMRETSASGESNVR